MLRLLQRCAPNSLVKLAMPGNKIWDWQPVRAEWTRRSAERLNADWGHAWDSWHQGWETWWSAHSEPTASAASASDAPQQLAVVGPGDDASRPPQSASSASASSQPLPPPTELLDTLGIATDDLWRHRQQGLQPASWLPQENIMMALGRPVKVSTSLNIFTPK